MKKIFSPLKYGPAVCAVGKNYQIMIPVKREVLMKLTVAGKDYFNSSNGVRHHGEAVQKFTVPQYELDKAGSYTVIAEECPALIRKRGNPADQAKYSADFLFRPVKKGKDLHIYLISDTHGLFGEPVKAAQFFGDKLDLLIMNGDISSSSSKLSDIFLIYKIAYQITRGSIPCIITRGNHDLRGACAEQLEKLLPTREGKHYYSATLGGKWFLVLDCGEDKLDSHREYYGTADFHSMRLDETGYLHGLVKNAACEYLDKDVDSKILISHIACNHRDNSICRGERPFNIEDEIYSDWCSCISDNIRPNIYLTGHMHTSAVHAPDSSFNDRHLPCTTVIAGEAEKGRFTGAAITLKENCAQISFCDNFNSILSTENISFK